MTAQPPPPESGPNGAGAAHPERSSIQLGIVPTNFKTTWQDMDVLVPGPDGAPQLARVAHVVLRFETPIGPLHFFWPAENVLERVVKPVAEAAQDALKPRLDLPPGVSLPSEPWRN